MKAQLVCFLILFGSVHFFATAQEHNISTNEGEVIHMRVPHFEPGAGVLAGVMATSVSGTHPMMDMGMDASSLMLGRLFTPATIMHNQESLKLNKKQIDAIKKEMRSFQSGIVDIQWDLNTSTAAMKSSLIETQIDLKKSLHQIDEVLKAENKLKKMHVTMLINIHNVLTDEQQKKLRKRTAAFFMGMDEIGSMDNMMMVP